MRLVYDMHLARSVMAPSDSRLPVRFPLALPHQTQYRDSEIQNRSKGTEREGRFNRRGKSVLTDENSVHLSTGGYPQIAYFSG